MVSMVLLKPKEENFIFSNMTQDLAYLETMHYFPEEEAMPRWMVLEALLQQV